MAGSSTEGIMRAIPSREYGAARWPPPPLLLPACRMLETGGIETRSAEIGRDRSRSTSPAEECVRSEDPSEDERRCRPGYGWGWARVRVRARIRARARAKVRVSSQWEGSGFRLE